MALRPFKYGTGFTFVAPMIVAGGTDFAGPGDWTPAAGDVKVIKDGGTPANITTLPTAVGNSWLWTVSDSEAECAYLVIQVVDSATKAVEDNEFVLWSYGHASAAVPVDLSDTVRLGLTALPNAAAGASGGLPTSADANGRVDVGKWKGSTPADLTDTDKVQVSMQHLPDGIITAAKLASNAITAAKIAANALDNKGNWNVGKTGYSLSADQSGVTIGTVGTVTNGVTVSTNNDKTGYSLSAGGVTAVQSGLATSAEVTAIQNTTRSKAVQPAFIERPDSGSVTPELRLFLYDTSGNMEDADSTPTIAITNSEGVDRSGNLSVVSHPGTGQYQATYTVSDSHAVEHLQGTWSYVEGGNTIVVPFAFSVVDTAAVDFTSADRTKLEAVYDKLPSASYLTGTASADGSGYATTNPDNAGIATISGIVGSVTHGNAALKALIDAITTLANDIKSKTDNLPAQPAEAGGEMTLADGAITADKIASDAVSAIQDGLATAEKMLKYFQLISRSDAAIATDNATELAEINADGGSGPGDYDNEAKSLEATTAPDNTSITTIKDLLQADIYIDKSGSPWELVLIKRGTGGLGTGVELLRQELRDVDGDALTGTDTVIGQQVSA